MYVALKEAMTDPKRNLLLRKTMTRIKCQVAHHEVLDVPTPPSLALPTEEPIAVQPEKAINIEEHLENVIPWVVVNGSKSEIEFFSAFSEKVDAAVNKEKKQSQTSRFSAGFILC